MFSRLPRRFFITSTLSLAAGFFLSCSAFAASEKTLKLGIIPGPEEQLAIIAKDIAKTKGIDVQLVHFQDYNLPNEALVGKDIDANAIQHKPFLDAQIKTRGYKLTVLGNTWVEPLGYYSHKVPSIDKLPDGATIGIQNDTSNRGRALNLLEKHGLICFKKDHPDLPSLADIVDNPHHFKFIEMDAAQLARSLDDLSMSCINTNFVIAAGIDPKTVLIQEDSMNNPYANIIAVRQGEENLPEMKVLLESFHSDAVRKAMLDKFHGAILPAW